MAKEKSFPWIPLTILFLFGVLCFWGGFLSSNIANKKKLHTAQARLSECENKFLSFSEHVIGNADAAVRISEGVSSVWHGSVKNGHDFNAGMEKFLAENKQPISDMKAAHDLIEIQVAELEKYRQEFQNEFEAVMELYGVYKKLYALGMDPAGTLEGFDSNRDSLTAEYDQVRSKLFVYMPELKKRLSEPKPAAAAETPQAKAEAKDVSAKKAPMLDKAKLFVSGATERMSFDQRIRNIKKDMTYREVESTAGVPRDKNKDSQGHEVWIYPSEKAGFRNCVYFDSGKVINSQNLPLKSSID